MHIPSNKTKMATSIEDVSLSHQSSTTYQSAPSSQISSSKSRKKPSKIWRKKNIQARQQSYSNKTNSHTTGSVNFDFDPHDVSGLDIPHSKKLQARIPLNSYIKLYSKSSINMLKEHHRKLTNAQFAQSCHDHLLARHGHNQLPIKRIFDPDDDAADWQQDVLHEQLDYIYDDKLIQRVFEDRGLRGNPNNFFEGNQDHFCKNLEKLTSLHNKNYCYQD